MRLLAVTLLLGCSSGAAVSSQDITTQNAPLSASTRPGMGAIPYGTGVTFRVWAPFASHVYVKGDWNGWQLYELGNEFNGNFSGDCDGAQSWQKYKYVIENQWGHQEEKGDPRAYRVENSAGASIVPYPSNYVWQHDNFHPAGNDELVIYELHIGTFNDAPGWGPGNWQSANAKLDYLRDLGINMIEMMPVAEFPTDFSWGYDPSYPFAPESAYGTPEDLKAFVDQAHARGIGVIVDAVHSHYGPNDLPLWCFTGDCLGAGGVYFYTDWRAHTPWGDTRPDFGRGEVRDYVRDAVVYWLDEYHLDGVRMDGTSYMYDNGAIPEGYSELQYVTASAHAKFPWKLLIAEDFQSGDATTSDMGFDSQWDDKFVHPMRDVMVQQSDGARSMPAVQASVAHAYNGTATHRVIYTESHDDVANGHSRVPEEIWPGNATSWAARKRSTLGAAVMLTSPGIPMLFEGQEVLESGAFNDSVPIDWTKASSNAGILALYRDLIHLRRNWNANTGGLRGNNVDVFHVNDKDKLIAYHRWSVGGPGDDVIVLANFSQNTFANYVVGMPHAGLWHVRFNSDSSTYGGDYANTATFDTDASGGPSDGMAQSANVTIGPYTAVILSQ